MKRVKPEKLQNALLTSLKKQNFCDSQQTFCNNFSFEETTNEMTHRLLKESSCGTGNVVGLMAFSLKDYSAAFESLRAYLQKLNPPSSSGLKDLCLLTFVHIYLELVLAGRVEDATNFFVMHNNMHLISQEKNWMGQLKDIKSVEALNKSQAFSKIVNNFMEVRISPQEEKLIRTLVESQKNLVLLKIFNMKLKIQVMAKDASYNYIDNKNSAKQLSKQARKESVSASTMSTAIEKKELPTAGAFTLVSPSSLAGMPHTPTKNEAMMTVPKITEAAAQEIMINLRKSPPRAPHICMFKFENDNEGMTHASLSNNQGMLCGGFESSSVKLWNLKLDTGHNSTPILKIINHSATEATHLLSNGLNASRRVGSSSRIVDTSRVTFFGDKYNPPSAESLSTDKYSCHELLGHSGSVYGSCFTHDDSYLLTCSEDSTVRLWSTKDYLNKSIYRGHNWSVSSVCCSNLSYYFATGSFDTTARLWNLERTFPLRVFIGHKEPVNSVSFHPNCSYIMSACSHIRMWDMNQARSVRMFTGHSGQVHAIRVSHNGKFMASADEYGQVVVWDIATATKFKEFRAHTCSVYSLDFSPDDSMLVSSGADGSICVLYCLCQSPQDSQHVIMNSKTLTTNRILMSRFVANNIVYTLESA